MLELAMAGMGSIPIAQRFPEGIRTMPGMGFGAGGARGFSRFFRRPFSLQGLSGRPAQRGVLGRVAHHDPPAGAPGMVLGLEPAYPAAGCERVDPGVSLGFLVELQCQPLMVDDMVGDHAHVLWSKTCRALAKKAGLSPSAGRWPFS